MTHDRASSTPARRVAVAAVLAAVAAGTVAVAGTGTASGHDGHPAVDSGQHQHAVTTTARDLGRVRAATARFHDVSVAQAAGYVPVSHCEELAGSGAMGVHYLHPQLAADGAVDPRRPEVLLYLPTDEGLRLVGVEWFVAEAAAAGEHPEVLGVPFDGPMPGHSPDMPSHYDLHAWIWSHNPTGTFAAWNSALTCGSPS